MNKYARVIRNRDQEESSGAIGRFAGIFRNGWLISLVFILVTALGLVQALTSVPLYEASTVIQIKRSPALAGDFRTDDHVATEIEVLRSRSILSRVVQRLQLDIRVDPQRRSIGGVVRKFLADDAPGDGVAGTPEQVRVTRFDVPPSLFRHPFILTTKGQEFNLVNDRLGIRIDGTMGTPARAASRYGPIGILVAGSDGAAGSGFVVRRVSAAMATEQLQRALVVSENAKQSNVIKVALEGASPSLLSRILGEIVNEYKRQRFAEQLGETGELAASFDRQIDESKAALRDVDRQYARLLQRSGIGDPEAESQSLSQQSSALETQLAEAQQRKAELSTRYGEGHPAMEAINRQIASATRNLSRNAARRESLAVAVRELASVRRDKQTLDDAALALLNQRAKLTAMMAAEREDVRLLDQPETSLQAVTPRLSTMVILSGFGGVAAGLIASFIKNVILQHRRARLAPRGAMGFRLLSSGRMESSRNF